MICRLRHRLIFVCFTTCLFTLSAHSVPIDVPFLAGRVNDYAGMLAPATITELENLLKAHEDSTSNQVVVLTMTSLQGEVLEEYSMKVVETWKLGQKDKDNGVLLLVVRDDRKIRIEVGDGLEGDLPDILCGRIIRNEIVPRFRDGDYEGGIRAGVNAIIAAIAGSYRAGDDSSSSSSPGLLPRFIFFAIFILGIGAFTLTAIFSQGAAGWILYVFLIPFWVTFPLVSLGPQATKFLVALYLLGFPAIRIWFAKTKQGRAFMEQWSKKWVQTGGGSIGRGGRHSSVSSRSSFSGGGGSFSGGGASGSW
ncbi:MAG: TPM domain-containing protein [candidate division KSB1 bacterium]|nr:TPM domain-containing protein [candidate division KSB1 bacterium]MDZ7301929.1 TPM domain-containing protein [candidate division KSB1 bacterium]MDZ7312334.1 TPM domain-containing protein [candidate division KSB1 bacterium]